MKKGKKLKFIAFLFYTYCIAHSLLPALLIALARESDFDKDSVFLFKAFFQTFLFPDNLHDDMIIFIILYYFFILLYEVVILFWPFYFYWRKRTVFSAWIVAMAGCLMPAYVMMCFKYGPEYYFFGILLMTGGYILAGLILHYLKRHHLSLTGRGFK